MKNKKFLSVVLAGVMTLSLATSAMATSATTDNTTGSQQYTVDATVNNATIKVTVPTNLTDKVKLNPYQLAYTDSMGTEIKEGVYSPVQYMTNLSNTAIGVTAAVKATQAGDVKLLADKTTYDAAVAASATTTKGLKNVYMYLEMLTVNDNMSAPTWAAGYEAAKHLAIKDVAASANGQQKKNIATMEAAENGAAAMEKGMVAFHFAGAVNDKTDDAWAAADKITLDITFTFTPLSTTTGVTPGADEAVTAGGGGGGGGGTTFTITKAACATGTFTVDKTTAASGDTVTVTANSPTTAGQTATVTVAKDSDSSSVSVTAGATGTWTFTMPSEAVTVTVAYA